MFIGDNKGSINECTLDSVKYYNVNSYDYYGYIALMCEKNTEKGVISDCNALGCSFVSSNEIVEKYSSEYNQMVVSGLITETQKTPVSETAAPETTVSLTESAESGTGTQATPESVTAAVSDTLTSDTAPELEKNERRELIIKKLENAKNDIKYSDADRLAVLCASNKGTIRTCSVESFSAEVMSVSEFGAICANNTGSVQSCRVEKLTTAMAVASEFGAIAGESTGKIIDVYSDGTVNVTTNYGNQCYIGGIVGRHEGELSYADSRINIALAPEMDMAASIGGVSGIFDGGSISRSSFGGNIKYTSTTYNNSYYKISLGGIAGWANCSDNADKQPQITDCYSEGTLAFDIIRDEKTNYDKNPLRIRTSLSMAGVLPIAVTPVVIENCYSTAELSFFKDGGVNLSSSDSALGGISNIQDYGQSIVRNCFFAGSLIGKDVKKYMCSNTAQNCYYTDDSGYVTENLDKSVEKTHEELLSAEFITKTLGWSVEVWDVESDACPRLREYVPPVEEGDVTDSAASTDTDTIPVTDTSSVTGAEAADTSAPAA